jgi:hypothetical protein
MRSHFQNNQSEMTKDVTQAVSVPALKVQSLGFKLQSHKGGGEGGKKKRRRRRRRMRRRKKKKKKK